MNGKVFDAFREIIEREAGIHLTDQKKSLLSNRIQKRLRALKLDDPADYLKLVKSDETGEELTNLIDVVSTNVTFFYRESRHFEILTDILEQYKEQKRDQIKIWCAAASSGEEPVTLAITAVEVFKNNSCDVKILGTDISTRVLHKAINGIYEEKQFEKMPRAVKLKYFSSVMIDEDKKWKTAQGIRNMVVYKRLNLAQFPYPLKGHLDVIFCRNVMIYFDMPLRARIIQEFYRLLSPGGYLFLSHSENLLGIKHEFQSKGVAVFRKPE